MKDNKKTFTTASLVRAATIAGAAALGAVSAVCIALGAEKNTRNAERKAVTPLNTKNATLLTAGNKSDEQIALEVEKELRAQEYSIPDGDSFMRKIENIFSES